jgi:hypothetical protein
MCIGVRPVFYWGLIRGFNETFNNRITGTGQTVWVHCFPLLRTRALRSGNRGTPGSFLSFVFSCTEGLRDSILNVSCETTFGVHNISLLLAMVFVGNQISHGVALTPKLTPGPSNGSVNGKVSHSQVFEPFSSRNALYTVLFMKSNIIVFFFAHY